MKTEPKNKKFFELDQLIHSYGNVKHGKTMWMLARNKTIINPIIADIRDLTKPTEEMKKYDEACLKLAKDYADLDEKGNPRQQFNRQLGRRVPQVIARANEYEDAKEALLEEQFLQAKLDTEEISKRGEELLKETTEVEFYRIPLNKIPGFRDEKDDENSIIMTKDMPLLIELGIVYEPEEGSVKEESKDADSAKAQLASV